MKPQNQKKFHGSYFKKSYLIFLFLIIASCGDNGAGTPSSFYFTVLLGDAAPISGQTQKAPNATIKVYTNAQAWLDGVAPLKTMTVGANGQIETNDKFALENVVFAESGTLNNWPLLLTVPTLHEDANLPGTITGGASIYESFLSLFESVSGKSFVLSDVRVNNVSIFANVSACSKDNFVKLQKNTKLLYSEGASICSGQTASTESNMFIPNSKLLAPTKIINGTTLFEFSCNLTNEGKVYVKQDFSQVWFSTFGGTANETVTIYTKQP